ncbi:MAG TPA: four-carbon acid sugar kinase family protein [Flexivirga sp.]|uniref:four-carbon acid sugar kinase family protein n=1 Tax=Flexivirga sp. TaxID=1962927 RepID=UPI002CC2F57F|nr:four-carbon acid sugar kinase family protein [Flexivirga sp.]HWC20800.1 four-carbon acid sugar kinase family protein [Flexivirga sp.]
MAYVAFVADDLTGASDVLAQAHRYGLDAVLVVGEGDGPLPVDADVVGIAGPSRSLGGPAFDELVRAQLGRASTLDADVLLYKVCSTFDSSPTRGSIGRAIELLHETLPAHGPVAVAPAQPDFGRYTAFSNHFAVYGGQIHRLDRHPVMSRHPSTPMHEADLRRVLAEQFTRDAAVDAIQLPSFSDGTFGEQWQACRAADHAAFVIDAAENEQLDELARALLADGATPATVVGSGGIMAALARVTTGQPALAPQAQQATGPVLTVSASASSTTAAQIGDAVDHGWAELALPAALFTGTEPGLLTGVEQQASAHLADGRSVVIHTTRGADDPRYAATGAVDAAHLGTILGTLVATMARRGLTRDIAVLGGDTSSHALTAMGVRELRVLSQFVTAGPVCHTDDDAAVAGCRLLLKGGQVGPTDVLRLFAGELPSTQPGEES